MPPNSLLGKSDEFLKWAKGQNFSWREFEEFWICWQEAQLSLVDTIKNKNQCDGCRRKMPIHDGIHFNPEDVSGWPDMIACTAHLYLNEEESDGTDA